MRKRKRKVDRMVEQKMSLVGPLDIAWNDAGFEDVPGVKMADLSAGAVVVKTFAIGMSVFAGVTNPAFVFCVSTPDGSPRFDIEAWNADVSQGGSGAESMHRCGTQNDDFGQPGAVALRDDLGATALWVRLVYDDGTLTAGSVRVFALIAEPAA